MTTIDKAAELLRQRIGELDRERDQLEKALKTLSDGTSGGSARRRRSRTTETQSGSGKAPRGKRRKELLASIRRKPDWSAPSLVDTVDLCRPSVSHSSLTGHGR